jgi:hypothetical protein
VELEIESHLVVCDDCRMVQEAATTTLDREFDLSRPSGRLPHLRNVTQAA